MGRWGSVSRSFILFAPVKTAQCCDRSAEIAREFKVDANINFGVDPMMPRGQQWQSGAGLVLRRMANAADEHDPFRTPGYLTCIRNKIVLG